MKITPKNVAKIAAIALLAMVVDKALGNRGLPSTAMLTSALS